MENIIKATQKTTLIIFIMAFFFTSGCSLISSPDPQPSCNFVQNKDLQRVSWKADLPLKFRVHKDVPKEAYISLLKAAAQWNHISTKKVIEIVKWDFKESHKKGHLDGVSTIYWLDTWESYRSSEQARTTIIWVGDKIKGADIRINSKDFQFSYEAESFNSQKVDFVSLMVHEMGHALGFAHSHERKSVMYPRLSKGYDRRKVKALSDLKSYRCEYGDNIIKPAVLAAALSSDEEEVMSEDSGTLTQIDEEEGGAVDLTKISPI